MDHSKKLILYIGFAAVAATLLIWTLFRSPSVTVETAVTKLAPMTVSIDGEGKTRVRNKHIVTAPISGKMTRIKLSEGNNIPRGYPIAEIDPNPPMTRTPPLPGTYPNPYATVVFTPTNGRVLRILQKSETMITVGTPIMEIGDPDDLEIVIDVLSTDAVRIPPGARILIENKDQGEPMPARVLVIESQAITKVSALGVEEQRVNVIGEFLSRKVRFGDNFRVDAKIILWEGADVLTIPTGAIFRNGENWNVFVVESGRARQKEIKIAHQNEDAVEIVSGLAEGNTVVVHPPNQLTDGASVIAR